MAIIIPALPYTLTNGTTADANQVMADLNDIVSGVNTNAAHNGPNSDITSLTGLTTPLSIGQGGTGVGVVGAAGTIPVSDGAAFAWSNTVNGPLTVTGAVNLNGAPNNIKGVVDNSNAPAGVVGEFILFTGAGGNIGSGVPTSVAGTTLQPGDWDVWGALAFNSTLGASQVQAGISLTTNVLPGNSQMNGLILTTSTIIWFFASCPIVRVTASVATAVYLVAQINFSTGTSNTQNPTIFARRRR
jgi:hypothetical protein